MLKNVGCKDRALRIVVGIVLIALVFIMPDIANPWGWIGIVPLATALIGWCPAYSLFGIKSCSIEREDT